ncbi:SDR family oxidoreductase [Dyadobacter luticola]|uniref:SDR family oxidoreductase n=1 Tax=Dyadobacter luticola TaxID=1979387 RepID=A0A5R9L5Z1_9BACT|nr:SDR family oxidoreductase [Dyadobacter luticola]TLV03700.1 SDR family oxidoreductase [Dyadobacter luticola]
MNILLTGATGYIGKRLLPILLDHGHHVICCVRDKQRFPSSGIYQHANISLFEVDFLNEIPDSKALGKIDAAYYLIHSMSSTSGDFERMETLSAQNFIKLVGGSGIRQIIYLGGITNGNDLSKHLNSRKKVEEVLSSSDIPLTAIKAGIIVGSGSASFEIIRDLVEKLPVMITPKWLNTKSQPIAIRNILEYLEGVLLKEETFNQSFDVGGAEILTYKQMLMQFAEFRGLKRYIISVPVMTPRLSSYWLYFVTSTSFKLASNLVNSMKVEVIPRDNVLEKMLSIHPISYRDSLALAFQKIEQNNVVSSWKDSFASSYVNNYMIEHIRIPKAGCFTDKRLQEISGNLDQVVENIWSIGGRRGWYYGNWLWKLRGFMDKMVGGVGLRRGRTNEHIINSGDTLDFWRVLAADKANMRLLLYAEMKLPGEAWLEFKVIKKDAKNYLQQTATFRPKGLLGRLYWLAVLPFHFFIFEGMLTNIIGFEKATR